MPPTTLDGATAPSHADDTPYPVVTVSIGGVECLRTDGAEFRVVITPFADQTRVAEALARAIAVFLSQQPRLSPIASAADAVEKLTAMADPDAAARGLTRIATAITDLSDRIGDGRLAPTRQH